MTPLADDELLALIELGRRNQVAIPLVHNWCAHARVVLDGPVGMLEQSTGLPIAQRRVTCAHERARSWSSMRLADNALEFHDRNCVCCAERLPVGLPNLSQLLQDREQQRADRSASVERTKAEYAAAIARRSEARATARDRVLLTASVECLESGAAHAAASVLGLLDEFDAAPNEATAHALRESIRAFPAAFTATVEGEIVRVAEAGGGLRTDGGLAVLEALAYDERMLLGIALRALARGEAVARAAGLVERLVGPHLRTGEDDDLVAAALPRLLELARPWHGVGTSSSWRRGRAAPFLALRLAAPAPAEASLRRALRSGQKALRQAGACAVEALLRIGEADAALGFAADLAAGFALPDGNDDHQGEAVRTTARVLSCVFHARPAEVGALLQETFAHGGPRERAGVICTYEFTFDRYEHEEDRLPTAWREPSDAAREPDDAERIAFGRLLDLVARLPEDQEPVHDAVDILRSKHRRVPWELLRAGAPTLLGICAMAARQLRHLDDHVPLLREVVPEQLRAVRRVGRENLLHWLAEVTRDLVIEVAREHPSAAVRKEVAALYLETLERMGEESNPFRARLVGGLGAIASGPAEAARVLPIVYGAFADRSQEVRGAAAQAYVGLSKAVGGADNLPSLVHESLLVLLGDPYVIVHDSALRALETVRLPDPVLASASEQVEQLVAAYADGGDFGRLALSLEVLLRLLQQHGEVRSGLYAALLEIIDRLPPYLAARFLKRDPYGLRGVRGYGELLVKLLGDSGAFHTDYDGLIQELGQLSRVELERLKGPITDAAISAGSKEDWRTEQCLQVLADAGAWGAARTLAQHATEACSTSRAVRPYRVNLEQLEAVIGIEAAAAAGGPEDVIAAVAHLRIVEGVIAGDQTLAEGALPYTTRHRGRLDAIEALADVADVVAHAPGADAGLVAGRLDATAPLLRRGDDAESEDEPLPQLFHAFAILIEAVAHLVRWVHAVRTAEEASHRHRQAARQLARDAGRQAGGLAGAGPLVEDAVAKIAAAATLVRDVTEVEDVTAVLRGVLGIPLPVDWGVPPPGRRCWRLGGRRAEASPAAEVAPALPPVAFITFRLQDRVLDDPQRVEPDVVYDLDLEVQLSRWPAGASAIEFVPLPVQPTDALRVPTFRLAAPEGAADPGPGPLTLRATGCLEVRAPQDLYASPLEVPYAGTVLRSGDGAPEVAGGSGLVVQGRRRLLLRSYDPARAPLTGFREVDERVMSIRDQARREGLAQDELGRFVTLLAQVGRVAQQALAQNLYRGEWAEAQFQDDLQMRLEASPQIGDALEKHPQAAGGITDLSFHGIRLELKVDAEGAPSVDDVLPRYGPQTAQYVVGSGRRSGVLAVLDTTVKTSQPAPVADDIVLRALTPPAGGRQVLLGVVVVRGNLARPSDLSRRARRTSPG